MRLIFLRDLYEYKDVIVFSITLNAVYGITTRRGNINFRFRIFLIELISQITCFLLSPFYFLLYLCKKICFYINRKNGNLINTSKIDIFENEIKLDNILLGLKIFKNIDSKINKCVYIPATASILGSSIFMGMSFLSDIGYIKNYHLDNVLINVFLFSLVGAIWVFILYFSILSIIYFFVSFFIRLKKMLFTAPKLYFMIFLTLGLSTINGFINKK